MVSDNDVNGDGLIDFPEFLSLMTRKLREAALGEDLADTFKVLDSDGVGYIQADDLHRMFASLGEELTDEEADMMIQEADADGDGRIDYLEFVKVMMAQNKQAE